MPYATDFEFEALEAAKNYRRAIAAEFAPFLQGHVLEIGAGIGQISREVLQLSDVSRLSLIEPDPEFAEHLRTLGQGTNVHQGTVADYPQGDPIDAIYSVNVLEHIEEDLEELKRYRDLLVNGWRPLLHFRTRPPGALRATRRTLWPLPAIRQDQLAGQARRRRVYRSTHALFQLPWLFPVVAGVPPDQAARVQHR